MSFLYNIIILPVQPRYLACTIHLRSKAFDLPGGERREYGVYRFVGGCLWYARKRLYSFSGIDSPERVYGEMPFLGPYRKNWRRRLRGSLLRESASAANGA